MKYIFFLIFFYPLVLLSSDAYKLGNGLHLSDTLNMGAYFSMETQSNTQKDIYTFDDIAFMFYGNLSDKLSYLAELEAVSYYQVNLRTQAKTLNPKFHYERLYGTYSVSDTLNFRLGRQITPLGYWNLEPINVLRDTSSNPLLSNDIFPKFFTGLDVYGYLSSFEDTQYHFFIQKNENLDPSYLNIDTDFFVGLTLETNLNDYWNIGSSLGVFETPLHNNSQYLMLNLKYDNFPFLIQTENIIRFTEYNNQDKEQKVASYLQSLYFLNEKFALLSRFEYIHNSLTKAEDSIAIFGYSYRPTYPISLKGEYQWHKDSTQDILLLSFSVLF